MGGHGGINILQEKRWHVWRIDNKLKVERDEMRHAAAQREERRGRERKAFKSKVNDLRDKRRGIKRPIMTDDVNEGESTKRCCIEDEGAERHRDRVSRGKRMKRSPDRISSEKLERTKPKVDQLNSRCTDDKRRRDDEPISHLNFFKEEEKAWKEFVTDRDAMLQKQRRGNQLAATGKSYGRSKWLAASADELSEFKQASKKPWYACPKESRNSDPKESRNNDAAITATTFSSLERPGRPTADGEQTKEKEKKKKKKTIEELRKERLDREEAERLRCKKNRLVLLPSDLLDTVGYLAVSFLFNHCLLFEAHDP
eukprot:GEMP01050213.1.p1 GENE.GEMP01050213.1~~GEMP01050213.1.p1  ORF type:complete len:313 (+),score=68.61 GEMP01050213.1:352-1290(+)